MTRTLGSELYDVGTIVFLCALLAAAPNSIGMWWLIPASMQAVRFVLLCVARARC